MPDALSTINTRSTPQSEQADPRQQKNTAGGFTFTVDDEARVRRFLILGTESGTYYTSQKDLTKDNAQFLLNYARGNATRLVEILTEVSVAGRAPRVNPTLFALAAASAVGDLAGRQAAHKAIPLVCRTGTHLFTFLGYAKNLRGRGEGLRRAVARWYTEPEVNKVAYQTVKYRNREGWTHRDVLRLVRPTAASYDNEPVRRALFEWIVKGEAAGDHTPVLVNAFRSAQEAKQPSEWIELIQANQALSWEMLPDAALAHKDVWAALIDQKMPTTALLRQLPRLTRLGVIEQLGSGSVTQNVIAQLTDPAILKKARIHPINVLVALKTYASGHSERSSSTWTPVSRIVDALDSAFYAAFGAFEPAGKSTMLALDVSGSMSWTAAGLPMTCSEASAAMALVQAATEPAHMIMGFADSFRSLGISPRQRLDDAVRAVSGLTFGRTDCAQPMLWAMANNVEIDTFAIYTDNETWFGKIHPHQALEQYRQRTGIDAKLVVLAMTPTQFSITDSSDKGMLDIVGLDSAVPTLINDFSRGDV